MTQKKLTSTQITDELWRRGELKWKMYKNQKELYEIFYNSTKKTFVWLLSRRSGKTVALVALAIEECLKGPGRVVKFLSPTQKQVETNLRPIFHKLLSDCPDDVKPRFNSKKGAWDFPNGSEIQLAGTDRGNADRIRGGDAHLCIIDEAGMCSDLRYMIQSILKPSMLITRGKLILATTPPADSDHEFLEFLEEAERNKTLTVKTIYENPMLTDEILEECIVESGGTHTEWFRREYMCVDEKTPIKTDAGYKFIKDIKTGDNVFTHKGRYRKVVNIFKNKLDNRKVYRVQSSNNIGHLCTEGHELYIAITNNKHLNAGYTEKWEKVENIDFKSQKHKVYYKVPLDLNKGVMNIEKDLAYLIGWHIAEGHVSTYNQASFLSLNMNDPIDEINKISKKYWGKEYVSASDKGSCIQYGLYSKKAKEFYKQFGCGAKNKFIPNEFKLLSNDVLKSLIKGIFSGDGFVNIENKRAGLTSISENLIYDVSDILNILEIPHQINMIREEGDSEILGRKVYVQNCYSIKIFGKNFDKFVDSVFNLQTEVKSNRSRSYISNGYLYSRIFNIETVEYNKPYVYDIEVEEDHSYVSTHAVFHNCEIIKNSDNSVLPEFTNELKAEIAKEWPTPPYFDGYVSMDVGFKDLTVVLFGYYDFRAAKLIIQREHVVSDKELHLDKLAKDIVGMEKTLWTSPYTDEVKLPHNRVSDIDYIVINELSRHSNNYLSFSIANKDNKEAAINNLRMMLSQKKIIIDPSCETLLSHLMHVKRKSKDSHLFARSTDKGHYDAVDALIYMMKAVDYNRNPYPSTYGYNPTDLYIRNTEKFNNNNQINAYKKIFNIGKK